MRETKTNGGGTTRKTPRCPTCGRPRVQEFRPFCSRRCRDVDLGRWFNQVYTIPVVEPDEAAEADAGEEDER